MTSFYFVRHGQSAINGTGYVAGWTDVDLTTVGEQQAHDVAQVVLRRQFAKLLIISSPLQRALKTAQAIAEAVEYDTDKIVILEDLKEKSAGNLETTTKTETIFSMSEDEFAQHGGESAEKFRERMIKVFEAIRELADGHDNVIIVAHAGVYKMAQVLADGLTPATAMYDLSSPDNAQLLVMPGFDASPDQDEAAQYVSDCPFCNFEHSISKHIHEFEHWNLFLHADKKRAETRQAAGFLASKVHVERPEDTSDQAWLELKRIIDESARRLCTATGVTYTGQEAVGFNQGEMVGQTVQHAHVHIFPVAEEDPEGLKGRAGMSAAFEALTRERQQGQI